MPRSARKSRGFPVLAIHLDWQPTAKAGTRDLRSGDELFYAFLGDHDRYCLAECYQRANRDGSLAPTLYVVRDAERVSDAEVREGKRPPVVFHSHDPQACVDWALARQGGKSC